MSKAPPNPKNAPAEIAKHLQRITHQHFFRSFEDWLVLAINAFLRDDDAYMKIMARYGPPSYKAAELSWRQGDLLDLLDTMNRDREA